MELEGRTALVTGSTDGVGRLVAERLAADGALVLVHGRDAARGEQVVQAIEEDGGQAHLLKADLASLDEVRRFAQAVERESSQLDVLINNAGLGFGGAGAKRETSVDGHELRFAVNYLAGVLLTALLLPRLKEGDGARIVNVASAGQHSIDFDDVMLTRGYDGRRAYAQSKLAQVMFTFDLAAELEGSGITVNCLHPATFMNTTMVREAGVTPWSSVEEGAEAICNLAASPALEGRSGRYFDGLREARANAQAYDADARRRLRELSLRLTGLPADAFSGA